MATAERALRAARNPAREQTTAADQWPRPVADAGIGAAQPAGLQPQADDIAFHPARPGPLTLVRMIIDPAVTVGALLAIVLALNVPFTAAYSVLSMLVFSLTFPGNRSLDSSNARRLAAYVARNWLLVTGLLFLLGWSTGTLPLYDVRVLLIWGVVTPLALFVVHRRVPALVNWLLAAEHARRKAVILGGNDMGRRLGDCIRRNPSLGVSVVGYFDDRHIDRLPAIRGEKLLGTLEELPAYVQEHEIDVIYVTLPQHFQPRFRRLLDALRDTTVSLYFVPDILSFELIQARVDTVDGIPVLAVRESPYYGINRVVKRLSDLVIASTLLLLAAPLMLLIAIGVKLGSPGPVLFKQRRYGLDGREILVYKFRTMTCTEDGDVIRQARKNDPRTTTFGAFLRRYSLDELPQLINVLQGSMSVVGPRPHAVAHNELYRRQIRGYMLRHKVKPGITGLAQVKGFRGETETVEKMRARIECDLEYLRNWSLLFDLRILLQTVGVTLSRNNAY